MPITFDILSEYNLVYVRYTGVTNARESAEAFAAFAKHPDARPGLRHLVDLTRLTDMDQDFAKYMELQAVKAETLASTGVETFMIYLATSPIGRLAANIGKNGWPPESSVVAIVQDSEDAALAALGIPHSTIADMLNEVEAKSA